MGNCRSCVSPKKTRAGTMPRQGRAKILQSESSDNAVDTTVRSRRPSSLVRQRTSRIQVEDDDREAEVEQLFSRGMILPHRKTALEIESIVTSLQTHVFFGKIQPTILGYLARAMNLYSFEPDSIIYREQERGSCLYIVNTGSVAQYVDNTFWRELIAGSIFGEKALICEQCRESTATARGSASVWQLQRSDFVDILFKMHGKRYVDVKAFLATVPLFQCLTDVQHEALAELLTPRMYTDKERIVQEGKTSELFYIVKEGSVRCLREGRELRILREGDFFGEHAFLTNAPRSATVEAAGKAVVLAAHSPSLKAVIGDQVQAVLYQNSFMHAVGQDSDLRKLFLGREAQLIHKVQVLSLKEGVSLDSKSALWVVLSGQLANESETKAPMQMIDALDSKACYWAVTQSELGFILKADLEAVWTKSIEEVRELNQVGLVLASVKLLQHLPIQKLQKLVQAMQVQHFAAGEVIFEEGQAGTQFFIVREGTVQIARARKTLRRLTSLQYFGERAIILQEPRSATATAMEETTCWVLSQHALLRVFTTERLRQLHRRMLLQDDSIAFSDLGFLKKIGSGSLGHTFAVVNKKNKAVYALKAIPKACAATRAGRQAIQAERKILTQLDHPLVLKLVKIFKDEARIYFLQEYVPGPCLLTVMEQLRGFSIGQTRFYTACILQALQSLHKNAVIHRDLKPENFIVDETGYPKLTDFAVGKVLSGRTFTLVGTPHYMAPEVIGGMGYSFSADCWSLGVMLYEFAAGKLPFADKENDPLAVYEAILEGSFELEGHMRTHDYKSLLLQLLSPVPVSRGTAASISKHKFFSEVQWNRLAEKLLEAPFLPAAELRCREINRAASSKENILKQLQIEEMFDTYDVAALGGKWDGWDTDMSCV